MILERFKTFIIRDWKHATTLIGEPTTMLTELLRKEFTDGKFPVGHEVTIKLTIEVKGQEDASEENDKPK